MANLPSQHPNLTLHLTDRALTPLITSGRAQEHLEPLAVLSHTALSAHESAQRLGLGALQRIMVEHDEGPVLLQTFLSPHPTTPPRNNHPTNSTAGANVGAAASQLSSPGPHTSSQTSRQHQGALALAAESRGAGPASTTTMAHLRGGAAHDDDDDEEGEEGGGHERPIFLGDNPEIDEEDENPTAPPMLVGIVVGVTSDEAPEARRATAKLERVGREIQERWSELQGLSPAPRGQGRADELHEDASTD
ncbi:hypothetical protein ANO14919_056850 [Xylariales sp. No.14919]|nr:hypothetical protein ANO14919_056850 [Xylariales sp. No.14919]